MATAIDAPHMSDDLWHALGCDWPEACRTHHCWVDQCPAGSHAADGDWDDNAPLPPGYPDWHCTLCGDSGMNGDERCDCPGTGSHGAWS